MLPFLHRITTGLASRLRNLTYMLLGVNFQGYCWLRAVEIPRQWSDITLHGCALDRGVVLLCSGPARPGKIQLGEGCYVNRYTIIDAHECIRVGRDVMIGPHCYITDANHGVAAGSSIKSQPMSSNPVIIEDEAWLGANVTVLAGVHIGRGAVIGAGSVVCNDIPADCIAFGSPASVRRRRAPQENLAP